MTFHRWGEENVDWAGIDAAAYFIGHNLRRWGRVNVTQYKEKFGCVRVYADFGFNSFHSIVYPGHAYTQWPRWLAKLDFIASPPILSLVNPVVVYLQQKLYVYLYKRAVAKWPHLKEEILVDADYSELF